jgi:hypothetical protein
MGAPWNTSCSPFAHPQVDEEVLMRNRFLVILLFLLLGGAATTSQADPILDGGWAVDTADGVGIPTLDSTYDFVLAAPAYLRVTDCCVSGDTWFVTDFGSSILTTVFLGATVHPGAFGDDFTGFGLDTSWVTPASFTRGEVLLAAGAHSLSLTTDGVGGIPAHVGVRLDSAPVPEPASLGLLVSGLLGLGGLTRRRGR